MTILFFLKHVQCVGYYFVGMKQNNDKGTVKIILYKKKCFYIYRNFKHFTNVVRNSQKG